MNSKISFGIGLIVGLTVGGGAGYYFTKKVCDAQKEEEIASVTATFDNMQKELIEKNRKEKEKMFNDEDKVDFGEEVLNKYDEITNENGYVSDSVQIEEGPKPEMKQYVPTKEEVDVVKFVNDVISQVPPTNTVGEVKSEPYLIESEDFANSIYEKEIYSYYLNDYMVSDENGDILEADSLLPDKIRDIIPDLIQRGEGVIYVRDEDRLKDLEIHLEDYDYTG